MNERILIIEDEKAIQDVLYDLLTDAGYEVSLAGDGIEGLTLYRSRSFALILLDIMMPKADGYAVCELIRKESDIPISHPFRHFTDLYNRLRNQPAADPRSQK